MANQVKFFKVNGLTKSGLTVGGIYFDKTTGIIHVATSATTTDEFGVGVKSATLVNNVLEIVNQDGDKFSVDFKDIASASSVVAALNTKLNIGEPGDDASIQSYYGLKADIVAATTDMATNADVDDKIAEQAAADKAAWEAYADQAEADAIAAAKVKDVDTTATNGVNLSVDGAGKLDVTVTPGTIASGNASVVTGGAVYTAIDNAKTALIGVEEASADDATIAGAKAYADSIYSDLHEQIEQKNVGAAGDALVSATAADNNVTVAATEKLTNAVALAESALQASDKTELQNGIKAAKTVVTEKADGHVTVTKSAGTDGNDVYTIAESDIASAQALSGVDDRVAAIETLLAEDGDTTINNLKDVIDYFNGVKEEETGAALISQVSTNKANIEAIESDYLTSTDRTALEGATTAVSNRVQTIENSYVKSVATTHAGGSFIAVTPVDATNGAVTINVDETALNTKIAALETAIGNAEAAGVTSFGGKTGAVTVKGGQNTNGAVNLAMSDNELQASIVGLGSAAYTNADAYATAAQGAKADAAIQSVNFHEGSDYIYIELADDQDDGAADAQLLVATDIAQASDTNKKLADAYAVKTYVDSQVTSALEWAEFN